MKYLIIIFLVLPLFGQSFDSVSDSLDWEIRKTNIMPDDIVRITVITKTKEYELHEAFGSIQFEVDPQFMHIPYRQIKFHTQYLEIIEYGYMDMDIYKNGEYSHTEKRLKDEVRHIFTWDNIDRIYIER